MRCASRLHDVPDIASMLVRMVFFLHISLCWRWIGCGVYILPTSSVCVFQASVSGRSGRERAERKRKLENGGLLRAAFTDLLNTEKRLRVGFVELGVCFSESCAQKRSDNLKNNKLRFNQAMYLLHPQ